MKEEDSNSCHYRCVHNVVPAVRNQQTVHYIMSCYYQRTLTRHIMVNKSYGFFVKMLRCGIYLFCLCFIQLKHLKESVSSDAVKSHYSAMATKSISHKW
jgi:hypothetical protein